MPAKHTRSPQPWTVLGSPQGGTVAALAISQENGNPIFASSNVGLYRSLSLQNGTIMVEKASTTLVDAFPSIQGWQRLPEAPLGIMTLAVSPNFSEDHTIIAGTNAGIFLSENAGDTWRSAMMPPSSSMILSLCFSPNYLSDGIILAGTLEDGIFLSNNRGERWSSQGFGLLDPTVYCLVISPNFSQDGTIFAGTGTAVYYSYNGGRAWRQLDFPEEAAPILSLAILTHSNGDYSLYAGTEAHGLYRSNDQGQSWQMLNLPAVSVNAILVSQDHHSIWAATEIGILQSMDSGETWIDLVRMPDVLTMVTSGVIIVAGFGDQGLWMSTNRHDWQPIRNLTLRSLLGLAVSAQFKKDGTAYMFGPEEGIWKTSDGGHSWSDLSEALPNLEINSLALSPNYSLDKTLLAATKDSLLISKDAGTSWNAILESPAHLASISPNGKILVASFTGEGIMISDDQGETWNTLSGPWDMSGQVLAIAVTNLHHFYIAHLEGVGETMTLWQGKPEHFEKVFSEPTDSNPHVSFWFPYGPAVDRPWYVSLGSSIWKISSRLGGAHSRSNLPIDTGSSEMILTLTGTQDSPVPSAFPHPLRVPEGAGGRPVTYAGKVQATDQVLLFACTGRHLYQSLDNQSWNQVYDFGDERAVALTLSSSYPTDKTAFALLLGGSFCKIKL